MHRLRLTNDETEPETTQHPLESLTPREFIRRIKQDHDVEVTYTLYTKGTTEYASDFIAVHGRDNTNCYRVEFGTETRIFIWTSLDVTSMSQWAATHGRYNIHEVFIDSFRYRFFLDIDLKVEQNYRWMSLFTHDTENPIANHCCSQLTSYLETLIKLAIHSIKGECKFFSSSYDIRNRVVDGKLKYSVHLFTNIVLNKMSEMKAITEEMVSVATYQLNYYSENSKYDAVEVDNEDEFEAFLELVAQKQSIIDAAPYGTNKSLSITGSYKNDHCLIKQGSINIEHSVRIVKDTSMNCY